jgi:hypothetical protein
MALTHILRVQLQPGATVRYEEAIRRLAEGARKKKDPLRWVAYQTLFGTSPAIAFVTRVDSFAELAKQGTPQELVTRVLGEKEAPGFAEETLGCVVASSQTVSLERPDLSYVRNPIPPAGVPFVSVNRARVRFGMREAYEELIRKLSEAIPKVDDPATLIVRQVIVGALGEYLVVRPLRELAELDAQRSPDQLLTQAFGPGEGGLIFRNGGEAIESLDREIVARRDDLSHAPA